MTLERYRRKRHFDRTPEPRGGRQHASTRPIFVVQKHAASHLHYDFRLQIGDVLASWAVPKGPSLDPSAKRLAVHVEDHPLAYATFEGTIPPGEYGGGSVMLWDRGTWSIDDGEPDVAASLRRGKISFVLQGERLKGGWTLARMRDSSREHRDNWLLIKHQDDHALADSDALVESNQTSVATGRTMEEIGQAQSTSAPASKPQPRAGGARTRRASVRPANTAGARRAAMPNTVSPQLCTLTDRPPEGDHWIHEVKFDGYRLLAHCRGTDIRLTTRAGNDWTGKFGPLTRELQKLGAQTAILDGEVTIVDADGRPSFQMLQRALAGGELHRLVYFVFDIVYLNGYDLQAVPVLERKALLRQLLLPDPTSGLIRYSDHVQGRGLQVGHRACELALEGIVCKRTDARYEQRRSTTWLKVRCSRRQEFAVIGWTSPAGTRKHFGSLLLGAHVDGRLVYTGRVGTGFDSRTLRDIKRKLDDLKQPECPADEPPTRSESRGAHWVKPSLVAEVSFTQWTRDARLRHPTFEGLREDKPAAGVRVERPRPLEEITMKQSLTTAKTKPNKPKTTSAKPSKAPRQQRRATRVAKASKSPRPSPDPIVAGVRITHPSRVVYPDAGLTKLDVAQYYAAAAERMLPHVVGRPLSVVRCPDGLAGQIFFQKHARGSPGMALKSIRVPEHDGDSDYLALDSVEGLLTLVQFGMIEIHTWGSSERDLEHPDTLTIDLDPGEGVNFESLREAAQLVRSAMKQIGLKTFLKLTGGKGLHVVMPLEPSADWEHAKAFCETLARGLASEQPGKFVAIARKALRPGKIFVDYLRNGRGATAVAPFSLRARPRAPVAMPVAWTDLASIESASQYTLKDVMKRFARSNKDPWKGIRVQAPPLELN